MNTITAADFFLHLPHKERKTVMLKVVHDATEMQRDVIKKAEKLGRTAKKGRRS